VSPRLIKAVGSSASIAVLALDSAAPALAAKNHHKVHAKHKVTHAAVTTGSSTSGTSTSGSSSAAPSNGETALTGTALSSASAAAVAAVPGGTVTTATSETDSTLTGAAYEVHVTKTDGSKVVVIEDASFAALATQADQGCHGGTAGGIGGSAPSGS
jgi:hypothetical protein